MTPVLPSSAFESTQPRDGSATGTDGHTAVADRRASHRHSQHLEITMTPMGEADALGCNVEDISTGGMFVCMPHGSQLEVGQRVEVAITDREDATGGSLLPDGATCYATVIRTEQRLKDAEHIVGAGLRFDHPLFIEPATLL